MEPLDGDVTQLLRKWRAGDRDAEGQLFALVMPDLRRLARCYIFREKADEILQPSALVNEAYLRLVSAKEQDWQNRQHFSAIAARTMRFDRPYTGKANPWYLEIPGVSRFAPDDKAYVNAPSTNALYAIAAVKAGELDRAAQALDAVARFTLRGGNFEEVYEPNQNTPMKRVFYQSEKDFTWGASWYLRAYSDYQAAMASRSQPHV